MIGMPPSKPVRLHPSLTGAAGTYFVAAELSRRGYIATMTIRNAPGIDMMVTNTTSTQTANIQVKTNQGSPKKWILNVNADTLIADRLFYVLVNLNGQAVPAFHVVESAIVAEYCRRTHREWLAVARRDGSPHKDSPVREFHDAACVYLNAWDRLGLDA
jgi:hypothetical protein